MNSQNTELFYYVMAVYCAAALTVAVFPTASTNTAVDGPSTVAAGKSEPTNFAGAQLVAGKTEF